MKCRKQRRRLQSESGTTLSIEALDVTAVPAPTDLRLRKIIDESARDLGFTTKTLPSGAGHDAQDMARLVPSGMIFVPSVGGISHSPKEFTHPQDMANGATVLLHTILRLDAWDAEDAINRRPTAKRLRCGF